MSQQPLPVQGVNTRAGQRVEVGWSLGEPHIALSAPNAELTRTEANRVIRALQKARDARWGADA